MTEYIEKNKAIKELYEVYDYEFPTASGGFDEYARMIVPNTIKNMPAADVAPVRHGEWEIVVGSNGKEYMVCTCCRVSQDLTGVFTYCPNCGSKMDGGED